MDKFNKGKKFGGGRSFGGGSFGGGRGGFRDGRNGGRPPMFKATCSKCGRDCELPFRPTGERPVFCSTCFEEQGGGNDRPNKFPTAERWERPRFEDKQMHDAICSKCGANCQVPFRPVPGKKVFCENCFEKGGKGTGDNAEQFKQLNEKLDRLITLLTAKNSAPKETNEKKSSTEPVAEENKTARTKPRTKKVATKKKK
jgi:CxxC-x17-CxxC domain-containing protein